MKKWLIFLFLILTFSFILRLIDLNKPTETADEFAYFGAGISYYYNLIRLDFNPDHWVENKEHPPVSKYFYGIVDGIYLLTKVKELPTNLTFQQGKELLIENKYFVPSRLLAAIMSVSVIAIVFLIGMNLFDLKTGVVAAIVFSLLPHFIAHSKIAGLEMPSILFYTLALYFFLKASKKNQFRYYIFSAISAGLAIGTRFNNFSIVLLLPLLILIQYKKSLFLRNNFSKLIIVCLVPLVVFYVLWPYIWHNPLNILESLGHWAGQPKEYFSGTYQTAPIYYFVLYLIVTTPAVILFFLIYGLLGSLKKIKEFRICCLVLWFLVPLILNSIFIVSKQDGIRYSMIIYPPLALISSIGLLKIVNKLKLNFFLVLGLSLTYLLLNIILIHPYYLDYYSELVGSPKNVLNNKWFEVGWWGEGISEATEYINSNAKNNSKVQFFIGPAEHLIPKLRNDLIVVQDSDINNTTDYLVINTYYLWYTKDISQEVKNFYKVYDVNAFDANIANVYKHK